MLIWIDLVGSTVPSLSFSVKFLLSLFSLSFVFLLWNSSYLSATRSHHCISLDKKKTISWHKKLGAVVLPFEISYFAEAIPFDDEAPLWDANSLSVKAYSMIHPNDNEKLQKLKENKKELRELAKEALVFVLVDVWKRPMEVVDKIVNANK